MEKLKKSTVIILAITLVLVLVVGCFAGFEITCVQERDNYISLNGEHIRSVFSQINIDENVTSKSNGTYTNGEFKATVYISISQKNGFENGQDIYFADGSAIRIVGWLVPPNPNFFDKLMAYYPEPEECGYKASIYYQQLNNGVYMSISIACNYPAKAYTDEFWNFVSQQIDKAISEASVQEVA